ncbi:MAG TPA: hypothetical protein PK801_06910 [Aggregatilineales bacterium]|nr:hypothetical protein [Chloroflexota bacterium]HOA23838.1 hypothetical protein [Aggregatilineales bacterium]HPV07706.1 hypothetical protein [Aggregatilineales bacterium]HQA68034.1 hypothetical protein [Aggregatilineales bacterium]HQE19007.1 hypothetical protein [Aggregatilineales bacterium]
MPDMQNEIYGHCTVCGLRLSERLTYRGRNYCRRHLETFSDDVDPLWQTSLFILGLLLAVIVALAIAGQFFGAEVTGAPRIILGVAISVLPALLWLFFLTRLAALREVELSPLLPTMFVLAALIAAAIARPLLFEIIDLDGWLAQATASSRLSANILLGGSIHAFLLYAMVRYTVWQTPSFEHRADGVLYGLVTSWGYAATYNTLFVFDYGGVSLVNGSYRILTQTFAFLVTGLVLGYFLGRNRFEDMPFYFMSAGVALAGFLNGFLFYAGTELNNIAVNLTSDGFSPWPGLLFNLAFLVLTFAAVYGLLRRHNKLTKLHLESISA